MMGNLRKAVIEKANLTQLPSSEWRAVDFVQLYVYDSTVSGTIPRSKISRAIV